MTKAEFTSRFNFLHYNGDSANKTTCIVLLNEITRLSTDMCSKLVNSLWGCSDQNAFGDNIYQLLEVSANADPDVQLEPKLKTNSCTVYIIYPDEHAAAFALFKIKNYKIL